MGPSDDGKVLGMLENSLMRSLFGLLALVFLSSGTALAADTVTRLGEGSYATVLPKGAKGPQETIWATPDVKGPMPTNDWWSSLAWLKYSERHYPHPLAVEAAPGGLRIFYPGSHITANRDGIFAFMPAPSGDDLILGHSRQDEFPDTRVDGFSDWFVTAAWATGKHSLKASYGHGSPFVFALYTGGEPRLRFPRSPTVWSGNERTATLGVSINGKHYGLFGPSGSTWTGLGTPTLTNHAGGKDYFSLAILPDNTEKTLALFQRYAHAHVTDTRVSWAYDPTASTLTTTFTFHTTPREGEQKGTLFSLYPHQWRQAPDLRFLAEYPSVRGKMKLAEGASFRTTMRFTGVLPVLPRIGEGDRKRLAGYLKEEVNIPVPPVRDTYADGKWLGKLATLIPLAEIHGEEEAAQALRQRMRTRLEQWFTATTPEGRVKDGPLFAHESRWGTLIGYPASFGSDVELNDHHFHYGYFIKGAAEMARHDPAWARDERWGGMVKLLIRDVACPERGDRLFPFLRNFDPYAGHSWASGHARFGDGNNNESSSEAMNAWAGLVLWGEATGDRTIRDLGIYLFTTEMQAIGEYWFDVHGENHPRDYTASVVTMIWGGKGANGTWFSARPEHVHGINWLPIHAGSLYLGHSPAYVEKNYAALVRESGGTRWKEWADIIWMYRALVNPQDALKLFEAAQERTTFEAGNSRANTLHWISTLKEAGQVDASVTADHPLHAVFRKGKTRTYCVYSMSASPRTVTFSDGFRLKINAKGLFTKTGAW
jgi:endoglucanase Acf2